MILESNVIIDALTDERNKADCLSFLDTLKLTLASFAARLFPDTSVYTFPQQEGVTLPCLFVDFYQISKRRRLQSTAQYEVGFTISYIAKAPLSTAELCGALFTIQQGVTDIQNYAVQAVDGDITDGIANVTGIIKINETDLSDSEIIDHAERRLII